MGLGLFQWYYTVVTGTNPHPILATILFISGGVCFTFGVVALWKWLPVEFPSNPRQRKLPLKQFTETPRVSSSPQIRTTNWLDANVIWTIVLAVSIASFVVLFLRQYLDTRALPGPLTQEQGDYLTDALSDYVSVSRADKKVQIYSLPNAKCKFLATQFEAIFKSAHISKMSPPITPTSGLTRGLLIFCEPGDGVATMFSIALSKANIPNQEIETLSLHRKGYFIVSISDQWF